jgi:peptidoglycan/xylan/chitin deacetylase (PgdA/CDA1 family)
VCVVAVAVSPLACGNGGTGTSPATPVSPTTTAPSVTTSTTGPPAATSTTAPASATTARTTITPSSTTTVVPDLAEVVTRGDPSKGMVALTFDAGSDAGFTGTILDMLAARHVTATFGLTGRWIDDHPDLARRIVAAGHQVLNHTYDHASFTGLSTGTAALSGQERVDQLARAEAALARVGGSARPWFRPPYGDRDPSVDRDVAAAGYRYEVLWSLDSLGWRGLAADDIVTRCLGRVRAGDIVLFHVGSGSRDREALPAVLDGLAAAGYALTTVRDLLA